MSFPDPAEFPWFCWVYQILLRFPGPVDFPWSFWVSLILLSFPDPSEFSWSCWVFLILLSLPNPAEFPWSCWVSLILLNFPNQVVIFCSWYSVVFACSLCTHDLGMKFVNWSACSLLNLFTLMTPRLYHFNAQSWLTKRKSWNFILHILSATYWNLISAFYPSPRSGGKPSYTKGPTPALSQCLHQGHWPESCPQIHVFDVCGRSMSTQRKPTQEQGEHNTKLETSLTGKKTQHFNLLEVMCLHLRPLMPSKLF